MAKITLKSGNVPEPLIQFLERDEYRFRTGYAKEQIWHDLKDYELTESQKKRLRKVAINYLYKRMQREFWYMCRYIRRIADEPLRAEVKRLLKAKDEKVRKRAWFLNLYLENLEAGERARKRFQIEILLQKAREHGWISSSTSCP